MTYTIRTYVGGLLQEETQSVSTTLTLAEREAVKMAERKNETIKDVHYPPGESRVESVALGLHIVRTVKPISGIKQ